MSEEVSKEQEQYIDDDCQLESEDSSDKTAGRWTKLEHELFLEGLEKHKKQWKAIAELVKTRTVVQVRTHAQKYFQKLKKSELLKGKKIISESDYSIKSSKSNGGSKKSNKSSISKSVSYSDDSYSRMTSESCQLTSSSSSTSYGGSDDGDISETDRGELIDILCFQPEQQQQPLMNMSLKRSRDMFEMQTREIDQTVHCHHNLHSVSYDFLQAPPTVVDKIDLYECLYGVDNDGMMNFWPETIKDVSVEVVESDKDTHCNFCNMIDDLNINLGEDVSTISKVDDNSSLFDSFHRERTLSAQFDSPSFVIPFSFDNKQPSVMRSLSVDTCLSAEGSYMQSYCNQYNSNYYYRGHVGFENTNNLTMTQSLDPYSSYSSFLTPKGIAALPNNMGNNLMTYNNNHNSMTYNNNNNSTISPVCKKRGRPRKDSDLSLSKSCSSDNLSLQRSVPNVPVPVVENPLILILKRNNSNNALNRCCFQENNTLSNQTMSHSGLKSPQEEELFMAGMLEAFE